MGFFHPLCSLCGMKGGSIMNQNVNVVTPSLLNSTHGPWVQAPIRKLKALYYTSKRTFILQLAHLQVEHYMLAQQEELLREVSLNPVAAEKREALMKDSVITIEAESWEPYLPQGVEDKVENYWLCTMHTSGILRFPIAAITNLRDTESLKWVNHLPQYYTAIPWQLLKPLDQLEKGAISVDQFQKTLVQHVVGIDLQMVNYYYDTLLPWIQSHWDQLEEPGIQQTLRVMLQYARQILREDTEYGYSDMRRFHAQAHMVMDDLTVGQFWPENETTNPLIGETLRLLHRKAKEASLQSHRHQCYDLLTKRNIPAFHEYLDTLREGLVEPQDGQKVGNRHDNLKRKVSD